MKNFQANNAYISYITAIVSVNRVLSCFKPILWKRFMKKKENNPSLEIHIKINHQFCLMSQTYIFPCPNFDKTSAVNDVEVFGNDVLI